MNEKEEDSKTSDSGYETTKYGCIFDDADGKKVEIRDVWAENLEEEMALVRDCVGQYPYVAMDTEFPGVVARPIGAFSSSVDYHYQTLRCNVDLLKIIQLGLTFYDKDGNVAVGFPTWQFNFAFSLGEDMYAQDSIDLLTRSGIDFKEHETRGISIEKFGELLIPSGLVLTDEVRWISFHSGYDFGYMLKIATCMPLPSEESAFFDHLKLYFPNIFDIKHLVRDIGSLKGGLSKLADSLSVPRIGPMHQAGSDALLTAATFFKLRSKHFDGKAFESKHSGVLYGLQNNTAGSGSS